MVSEMGGQLNNVLHSSITVCDLTQKIFLEQLLTTPITQPDHGSMDMRPGHITKQVNVYF